MGFTLKTSSNSEMCAYNGKLKIYLNIFLYATCSLYISLSLILNAPAPYHSIGKHFLIINSHLTTSVRSTEFNNTSYADILNFLNLSSTFKVSAVLYASSDLHLDI